MTEVGVGRSLQHIPVKGFYLGSEVNDKHGEDLPVLKLQSPPKCKRQLATCAGNSPQPTPYSNSPQKARAAYKVTGDVPDNLFEKNHVAVKRDCSQLRGPDHHPAPSHFSVPFTTSSPKKFRSQSGPIPSPSRSYMALVSPRLVPDKSTHLWVSEAPSPQNYDPLCSQDRICTCCSNTYVYSSAGNNRQSRHKIPLLKRNINGSLNTIPINLSIPETIIKQQNQQIEPNIFQFPPSADVLQANEFDELDGLDSPMDTDDYMDINSLTLPQRPLVNSFDKQVNSQHSFFDPSCVMHSSVNKFNSMNSTQNTTFSRSQAHYEHQRHLQDLQEQSHLLMRSPRKNTFNESNFITHNDEKGQLCGYQSKMNRCESENDYYVHSSYKTSDRIPVNYKRVMDNTEEEILDTSEYNDYYQDQTNTIISEAQNNRNIKSHYSQNYSDSNNNRVKHHHGRHLEQNSRSCNSIITADTNVRFISLRSLNYDDIEEENSSFLNAQSAFSDKYMDEPDTDDKKYGQSPKQTISRDSFTTPVNWTAYKKNEEKLIPVVSYIQQNKETVIPVLKNNFEKQQVSLPVLESHPVQKNTNEGENNYSSENGIFHNQHIQQYHQHKEMGNIPTQRNQCCTNVCMVAQRNLVYNNCEGKQKVQHFEAYSEIQSCVQADIHKDVIENKNNGFTGINNTHKSRNHHNIIYANVDDVNDKFGDEVDGLGDDKSAAKQNTVGLKQEKKDRKDASVVHCFDEEGGDDRTQTSTKEGKVNQLRHGGVVNTSKLSAGMSATETNIQITPSKQTIGEFSVLEREGSLTSRKNISATCLFRSEGSSKEGNQRFELGNKKVQQIQKKLHTYFATQTSENVKSDVCQQSSSIDVASNTRKLSLDVNSSYVRLCRRKSETSLVDGMATNISRSRSSPSKLGLFGETTTASSHKPFAFHRPWQDPTPGHESQTKEFGGKHQHSTTNIQSGLGTFSSTSLNKTDFPNPAHSGLLYQSHEQQCLIRKFHRSHPLVMHSPESAQESVHSPDDIFFTVGTDPANTHPAGQEYRTKLLEAGSKRKLEFSPADSRIQHQTELDLALLPSTSRQTVRCPVVQPPPVTDMQGLIGESSLLTHTSSFPGLFQQQERARENYPRYDDEVDIQVRVSNALQESMQLRHRLDRISQETDTSCECRRIEQNILNVALEMFRNMEYEATGREPLQDKLQSINQQVKYMLEMAENCRLLCRHGRRVTDILTGSVIIRMKCRTLKALVDLCDLHKNGDLHLILDRILSPRVKFDHKKFALSVSLDGESVKNCQNYLLSKMESLPKSSSKVHVRSPRKVATRKSAVVRSAENLLSLTPEPASPSFLRQICRSPVLNISPRISTGNFNTARDRKFSFGDISRIAFQELNITELGSPTSPSCNRLLRDEVFQNMGKSDLISSLPRRLSSPVLMTSPKLLTSPVSSPLTSPRKLKISDLISEQENISHSDD